MLKNLDYLDYIIIIGSIGSIGNLLTSIKTLLTTPDTNLGGAAFLAISAVLLSISPLVFKEMLKSNIWIAILFGVWIISWSWTTLLGTLFTSIYTLISGIIVILYVRPSEN